MTGRDRSAEGLERGENSVKSAPLSTLVSRAHNQLRTARLRQLSALADTHSEAASSGSGTDHLPSRDDCDG
jgi:hypothetical protein